MGWIARFFLLVLFLSFAELYLLIEVARRFSLIATLALCVLTGVVGGAMVRAQGLRTWKEIVLSLERARVPSAEIMSGLMLLVTGTLLLTPGFLTDAVAFLMLIPPLRSLFAAWLLRLLKRRIKWRKPGVDASSGGHSRRRPEDIVIEVEGEKVE